MERKLSINRRQSIRKVESNEKLELMQKNQNMKLVPYSKVYEQTIETEEIEGD